MGVWLNFELSAHKLYFTFQLLSEPLDSREKAGEKGEGGRKEEGFWAGWGCRWGLVGRVGARSWAYRPWKFPLYVSLLFRMGGVWNWTLGGGGEMVALGSGDLATSQPQQEAFASFTQTKKKKKWSWTLAGYLSTALQSSPEKQELINAACSDGGTG